MIVFSILVRYVKKDKMDLKKLEKAFSRQTHKNEIMLTIDI